jgi:hypothetical protein
MQVLKNNGSMRTQVPSFVKLKFLHGTVALIIIF